MRSLVVNMAMLALLLTACADGSVFKKGTVETKPKSDTAQSTYVNQDNAMAAPVAVSKSIYDMTVVTNNNGMQLCAGRVSITIWSDFNFKPEGMIECKLVGQKDIGAMFLDQVADKIDPAEFKKYKEFGRVRRRINPVRGQQGAFYSPPRPFILGPIIQDIEPYKNFVFREDSAVEYVGPEGKMSDRGQFFIKVLETGLTVKPEGSSEEFTDVIHWEISATGFANVPRGKIMLPNRMEYYFSTRPIAIPKIIMHSSLSDLQQGPLGGIGNAILGPVTITMSILKHNKLDN